MDHLFSSERLGFRQWKNEDAEAFYAMNSNPKVMEYFPSTLSEQESLDLMIRIKNHQDQYGFCYFAVDELSSGSLIGFTGITWQDYGELFGKFVDIGWRLDPKFWNKGYATEGANRCLDFGFNELDIPMIYAVATQKNMPSIHVMKKIGMQFDQSFVHPKLAEYPDLKTCDRYQISKQDYVASNFK